MHLLVEFTMSFRARVYEKSINFATDTEDHQQTERISPELVNGYRPGYAPNVLTKVVGHYNLRKRKTMEKPLVTIVVPIYNVEAYIHKCLDSILNQTYKNLEIILVDDGSPDNCPAFCDEYAEKDTRIKVIHKKNGGVCTARQAGLEASTGTYMLQIDPDDYVELDMVETLVKKAIETSADMVTSNYLNTNGYEIDCSNEDAEDFLRKILLRQYSGGMWSILFRIQLILDHNINFVSPKLSYGEDHLFLIRTLKAGAKLVHVNKAFYHYIMREGSIVMSRSRKTYDSLKLYIAELEKVVDSKDYDDLYNMKHYAFVYAYESKWFSEVNRIYPEIRERLLRGGNSDRYSTESQLARCMKSPPILVWLEAKAHKYLKKLIAI